MANSYVYGAASQTEHIVCESSLLRSTKIGPIASVKLHEDRDNGTLIQLAAWSVAAGSADEMQVYTGKDCADASANVYLVLQPAFNYDTQLKAMNEERYFYNKSGDVVCAYAIAEDDVFTVSANAIDAAATTPVVGHYVYFDSDNKYTEAAAIPSSAGTYYGLCQIIEKVSYKNSTSYRLHVIKPVYIHA